MYITHMRIQNYRNLQDVDMTFHEKANYIVGENAIGKSGLLRLLAYMSDGRNVDEDDYADPSQPIIITMGLHLLESDKEYFADKPDEALRGLLKKRGFKWSPRFHAWQRQLTSNAVHAAKEILTANL